MTDNQTTNRHGIFGVKAEILASNGETIISPAGGYFSSAYGYNRKWWDPVIKLGRQYSQADVLATTIITIDLPKRMTDDEAYTYAFHNPKFAPLKEAMLKYPLGGGTSKVVSAEKDAKIAANEARIAALEAKLAEVASLQSYVATETEYETVAVADVPPVAEDTAEAVAVATDASNDVAGGDTPSEDQNVSATAETAQKHETTTARKRRERAEREAARLEPIEPDFGVYAES